MGQPIFQHFPASQSALTSPGVTPGVAFGRSSTVSVGGYLQAAGVVSSNCGYPIFGKNKIVRVRATNSSIVGTNTVIRFQVRTGLNTFTDLVGSDVTILAGNYSVSTQLEVSLPEDPELSCYILSGSNLSNPIVNCFLFPDYT